MKRIVKKRKEKNRPLDSLKYFNELNTKLNNNVTAVLYTNEKIFITFKKDITNNEEKEVYKYLKDNKLINN
ncbi:MAG: hypothetical protein ACTSQY_03260 [Candidatus Odinarchaeia archaeon]